MYIYIYHISNKWRFPEIRLPPVIIHFFKMGFSFIHHPSWSAPISANLHPPAAGSAGSAEVLKMQPRSRAERQRVPCRWRERPLERPWGELWGNLMISIYRRSTYHIISIKRSINLIITGNFIDYKRSIIKDPFIYPLILQKQGN